MGTNERDPLRNLNWQQVYGTLPTETVSGVLVAYGRIRLRKQRRKRAARVLACAACLALAVGIGAFVLGNQENAPDRIATPLQEMPALRGNDVVYASLEDGFFHITPVCERAARDAVQLKLVTAREFEKEACPVCAAEIRIQEE